MKEKIYTGITKELIEKSSTIKESKEFDLSSSSGTITRWGVTIKYLYDPINESSTITIVKKPFLITYDYIWSKIDKSYEKIRKL